MEEEKIIEALKVIKKVCQTYDDCAKCPFRNWELLSKCHLKDVEPAYWCFNAPEEPWRAFM